METLRVELGDNSYNIYFNNNFDALINALDDINAPKKMLIVTDETNVSVIAVGGDGDEPVNVLRWYLKEYVSRLEKPV